MPPKYPKIKVNSGNYSCMINLVMRMMDFHNVREEEIQKFRDEALATIGGTHEDLLQLCKKWVEVTNDKE